MTALKTDGVDIQFTSPTSFEIIDTSPDDFMNFQITDTNLFVVGAGVGPIPEVSTLLLLSTGLAGFLGCSWRRRRHQARATGTVVGTG